MSAATDESKTTKPLNETEKTMSNENRSEAYHTGYEAHQQGEARTANPYAAGTYDSSEWFAGWDAAK